jgi:hypothetical protein
MILESIKELELWGVSDGGAPNQEAVVLIARERVNLGQYGIMIGLRGASGLAYPFKDNLFWFGDAIVNAGDWIWTYTSPGAPRSRMLSDGAVIYSLYWGRKETVFHNPDLVPILFRVDAVNVGAHIVRLPRAGTPTSDPLAGGA